MIELNIHIFSETTRIIITSGAGITHGFQNRVRLEQFLFNFFDFFLSFVCYSCNVLHNDFTGFSFACPGLSTNNHTLVSFVVKHVLVSVRSNRKDVRRQVVDELSLVHFDDFRVINVQPFVWVNRHDNISDECVNNICLKTGLDVGHAVIFHKFIQQNKVI
eukprot:Lithocolla_globosa_v1_NODE_960_length_3028_cov_4.252607.p2 type:complete len:161 gc:universal NODE_960_length_3028_cov_4.252607:535-53(-)